MMGDREDLRLIEKIRSDFPTYAARALKVKAKGGDLVPLVLNVAQQHLHDQAEKQLRETGKVRILGLKGRQQGFSTYTEGRYYYKVTGGFGRRAFILTHEDAATRKLFAMATRYHENMDPTLKPVAERSSVTELYFGKLDSGYGVGTARTKGTGRSDTIQYFHGSEVAWWPNQDEHMAGVLQALPNAPGTEAILETTANGIEMFADLWAAAKRGKNQWLPVFTPWFWQPEYRLPPGPDFEMDPEEQDYQERWGLDLAQMAWRRDKINTDFRGKVWIFEQEYPAYPDEAFQASQVAGLIDSRHVLAARKDTAQVGRGAKILGVDVARQGPDRSAAAFRHGRVVPWVKTNDNPDLMAVAGWVAHLFDELQPDALFVDETGGYGAAVVDRLRELNYPVTGVQFGGTPIEPTRYKNKRAEIWGEMNDWFRSGGVSIPDEDDLQTDLCGPKEKRDSTYRLQLESKEDMLKRGVPSPDKGDAMALTFSEPVAVAKPKPQQAIVPEFTPYDSGMGY